MTSAPNRTKHPTWLQKIKLTIAILPSLLSASAFAATPDSLTIYTYDSFSSKGSIGEWAAAEFPKKEKVKVRYVAFPTAGEALNQISVEGKATKADIVVGIDNSLVGRATEMNTFEPLAKEHFASVKPDLKFDPQLRFVPYDYGFITILYDSRRMSPLVSPMSLKEFSRNPSYKKKLVVQDPRTSSVGLGFFLGTRVAFPGAEFGALWKDLAKQIVTVSPGWSAAYGMFLKKEADYVVSYTTSPAYHIENEKLDAIKAVVFKEGNYRQIEAAGLVAQSTNKAAAKKFLTFLLSDEVQTKVATLQWMYPARTGVKLPLSYSQIPDVLRPLDPPKEMTEAVKRLWLRDWSLLVSEQL